LNGTAVVEAALLPSAANGAVEATDVGLVGEPDWLQPAASATQRVRNGARRAFIVDVSFRVASLGRRELGPRRLYGANPGTSASDLPSTPGEKNVEFSWMRNFQ
jgi:hypothetical protein